MTKIKLEVPQTEYEIIEKVAKALGVPVEFLMQQELDQCITSISVWTQRSELISG